MSYYILPKKNIEFKFNIIIDASNDALEPVISNSLFFYLNDMNKQIENIIKSEGEYKCDDSYREKEKEKEKEVSFGLLNKIMNPYEFIFTKVPNTKLSVSKLKPFSNTFYIFMEIINMFNLLDFFEEKNIKTIHYGPNSMAIIECLDMLREDSDDINVMYPSIDPSINTLNVSSIELLSYELKEYEYNETNKYIIGMIHILCNIIQQQSANGIAIIKIHNIFYKPIIDVLYILSSMYEKIYIIKPNNSGIYTNHRYIICKNFILNINKQKLYHQYLKNLQDIFLYEKRETKTILCSLIRNEIPYYFLNKIEESNIITGHQQLDYMNQLVALYKNKNKDDKIEIIKKNNIQKCIQWCEKFKIPYNKFTDKVNIFLPLIKIGSNDFYTDNDINEMVDELLDNELL